MFRMNLSVKDKINLLNELNTGADRKYLVYKYNVSLSTISRIKNHEDEIRSKTNLSRKTNRKSNYIELERALLKWCKQELGQHRQLNGPILMTEAKQLAKKLKENVVPSRSWLQRFCKRNQITCSKSRRSLNQIDLGTNSDLDFPDNLSEDSMDDIDDKDAVRSMAQIQDNDSENVADSCKNQEEESFVDIVPVAKPSSPSVGHGSQQKNSATKEVLINLCSLRAYCYENDIDVIKLIDEIENSILLSSKSSKVTK